MFPLAPQGLLRSLGAEVESSDDLLDLALPDRGMQKQGAPLCESRRCGPIWVFAVASVVFQQLWRWSWDQRVKVRTELLALLSVNEKKPNCRVWVMTRLSTKYKSFPKHLISKWRKGQTPANQDLCRLFFQFTFESLYCGTPASCIQAVDT